MLRWQSLHQPWTQQQRFSRASRANKVSLTKRLVSFHLPLFALRIKPCTAAYCELSYSGSACWLSACSLHAIHEAPPVLETGMYSYRQGH